MLQRFLPIIFFLLILLILFYFLFFSYSSRHQIFLPVENNSFSLRCEDGAIRSCSFQTDCNGYQECINGKWSRCIIEKICAPNSEANCIENGCSIGYKICNSCGTGYGECIMN